MLNENIKIFDVKFQEIKNLEEKLNKNKEFSLEELVELS